LTGFSASNAAVQHGVDFPGPRVDGLVLNGGFVINMIGVGEIEAFDHVDILGLEIAGPVEPLGVPIQVLLAARYAGARSTESFARQSLFF
jgi:hypothetical protein